MIMTIAPEADIYVARVAEDRKGLEGASDEIVAKVMFPWAICFGRTTKFCG